jgi:4'-phosphopantetheinyl transferase
VRLPADECHVWAVTLDALDDGHLRWLSSDEHARVARFRFDRDRRQHLASRALARAALSRYTGVDPAAWVFTTGPHGKPQIEGPIVGAPAFNVAHAGELVVCAVAGVDVGVDVEGLDIPDALALAGTACSPGERALLESLPPGERSAHFAALFTIKEAYLKARGVGMSIALDRIGVALDPDRLTTIPDDDPGRWQITRLALPGYQIATALAGSNIGVRLERGFPR